MADIIAEAKEARAAMLVALERLNAAIGAARDELSSLQGQLAHLEEARALLLQPTDEIDVTAHGTIAAFTESPPKRKKVAVIKPKRVRRQRDEKKLALLKKLPKQFTLGQFKAKGGKPIMIAQLSRSKLVKKMADGTYRNAA